MTLGNLHEDGMRTEDPETGEPFEGNEIGWIDPRATDEDGEVLSPQGLPARENMLAWAKRFPRARVKEYEYEPGQYAFAGQYQQSPIPQRRHLQAGVLATLRRSVVRQEQRPVARVRL
jgi:hypothetical protein